MIDLTKEKPLTAQQAGESCPKPVSQQTIYRWWKNGISGHVLESVMIGGKRYSTKEAVMRFVLRINGESVETGEDIARMNAELSKSWAS